MGIYRTAMGKAVDMSALQQKNEKIRAVGNMSVNARGDTIDSHGRIVQPVTSKVSNAYSKTVGNRSAQPTQRQQPKLQPDVRPIDLPDMSQLTESERELEDSLGDDLAVEKIKEEEIKKATKKK